MSHTAKLLFDKIKDILLRIDPEKFAEIVSNNASAIATARRKINKKYPSILNISSIRNLYMELIHFVYILYTFLTIL